MAETFCEGILCYGTCGGRMFCYRYISVTKYVHIKSTTVYAPRRNWDSPPTPYPKASVPPPPFSGGRGTLAGEKGVGRVPIPTKGIHCGTLYMYVLCDLGDGALQEYYLNSLKLLYRLMSLMALLSDLDTSLITVSLLGSCRGNNYGSWC